MSNSAKRRSAKEMRVVLAAQESSGLSVKSFCEEQGLNSWTLSYWRRRFRDLEAKKAAKHFAPVLVKPKPSAKPSPVGHFRITLVNSIGLEVPASFDERSLRSLVGVLRSC